MPCSNLVIWRKIPTGNRFAISADGKDDNFNITVAVDCDSGVKPPWRHNDIVPGPKKLTIAANDSCTLTAFVSVLSISGDPMTIDVWIEKPDGTKTDKQCNWSFSESGNFQIMINLDNQ